MTASRAAPVARPVDALLQLVLDLTAGGAPGCAPAERSVKLAERRIGSRARSWT